MFQSTVLSLICAMPIETKMIGMCVGVRVSVIKIPWDLIDVGMLHFSINQSLKEKIIKVLHWVGVEAMYPGFS